MYELLPILAFQCFSIFIALLLYFINHILVVKRMHQVNLEWSLSARAQFSFTDTLCISCIITMIVRF